MDNEDIYERFEISDYDLANEFNVNRGKRPTKEQQIYGIWADEEEEDEERGRADKKELKGINFVTGKPSAAEAENEKDDDDSNADRPSFSSAAPQWKRPSEDLDQFSGFRHDKSKLRVLDSKFCEFEKTGSGIGSKLLLKMGYEPGRCLSFKLAWPKNRTVLTMPLFLSLAQSTKHRPGSRKE